MQQAEMLFYNVLAPLLVAAAIGFVVRFVYQRTTTGKKINTDVCNAIPILSMIVTFVVIAIGGNLVHAISLLGTLAIIRFRTRVKTVSDMAYIFLVVAVGIATGLKIYPVALLGTVTILAVLVLLKALEKDKKP